MLAARLAVWLSLRLIGGKKKKQNIRDDSMI
jgi:hypothetical protein